MRRTRVQHNPKSSSYQTHHVDPTAMCGKQRDVPRESPDAPRMGEVSQPQGRSSASWQSAEGVVVRWQARLVRHSIRKEEKRIGRSRNVIG